MVLQNGISMDEYWSSVNLTQVIQQQLDVEVINNDQQDTASASSSSISSSSENDNTVKVEKQLTGIIDDDNEEDKSNNSAPPKLIALPELLPNPNLEEDEEVKNEEKSEDEMDELIPIMIKTDLPEFQQHLGDDGVILAGQNLNWFEFVQMLTPEPNNYILKGEDGRILLLNSKIGDYIDTFKRVARCYMITVEKRTSQYKSEPQLTIKQNDDAMMGSETLQKQTEPVFKRKSSRRRSPKRKQRKRNPASSTRKIVLEKIEISSDIQSESIATSSATLIHDIKKTNRKRSHGDSKNIDATPHPIVVGSSERRNSPATRSMRAATEQCVVPTTKNDSIGIGANGNKNSQLSSKKETIKEVQKPITQQQPNNKKPKGKSLQTELKQDCSKLTSSGNTSPPTTLPNIKPLLMNFMINKVSNKDMMRIREELMSLKAQDDYFKLTTLAPMTAGLLEQMLCRNLPSQDPS